MTSIDTLATTSKVWIYQSNREFTTDEALGIQGAINSFCRSWVSHNNQLKAFGKLYHNRFVVLMVDESQAGASGCSIDSSVHFIKAVGSKYKVDFFDRMNFAYLEDQQVKTAQRDEFASLYAQGGINDNTPVFDNLVKNKEAFENGWIKPLGKSWHSRMV